MCNRLFLCAAIVGSFGFTAPPAAAAEPVLTGFVAVRFEKYPNGDTYYYAGYSSSLTLNISAPIDISIDPSVIGPGTLAWSNINNWARFVPIDSSTVVINPEGPGGFIAEIPTNLSMLQSPNLGPTETGAYARSFCTTLTRLVSPVKPRTLSIPTLRP
jgi:hypothetical protein